MQKLIKVWQEVAGHYSENTGLIAQLWEETEKSYSAKKRHYHNLSHLTYMLEHAVARKESLEDPDSLLFSIFYHDLVYNSSRKDNEQRSAALAGERLSGLGLERERIRRIQAQIMATKDYKESSDRDSLYLIDFDLAILGESPQTYNEYAQKIWAEYALYPDFLYKKGRKKVLQHFLERETIFKTKEFIDTHEPQARKNLKGELQTL